MNYWIVPYNEEVFRLEDLLCRTDIVDWRQHNNFDIGDVVYIYNSKPYQRIRYKMEVIRINITASEYINDREFFTDKQEFDNGVKHNRFVRFKLLAKECGKGGPSYQFLRNNGVISNLQSPQKIYDSELQKKLRNLILPNRIEKIARICWNSNEWQYPSGPQGKSKIGFEGENGFGHEEWLLDRNRICEDGFHYGFIESYNKDIGRKKQTVHLYSITPDKRRLYVGAILDAEYVSPEQSSLVLKEYQDKGWYDAMCQEIEDATGKKCNEPLLFNIRFRVENFTDYTEKGLYISKDDPNLKADYYGTLYNKLESFHFEDQKGSIHFVDADSCEITDPNNEVIEGAKSRILVNRYERNPEARRLCVEANGCKCAVCGFDFHSMYGSIGKGFINVHHIKPIAEIGKAYKLNPKTDLVPVCANCHAMLHYAKADRVLSVNELKEIIRVVKAEKN